MLIEKSTTGLQGTTIVPGDKSISHRGVMLGALASGKTKIEGFLAGADCLATIDCFRKMGVAIEQNDTLVTVQGVGLQGLKPPTQTLDVGNSGTTMRLLLGLLAGQPFATTITGDASICRRPMGRVAKPLRSMGANIQGVTTDSDLAPLKVLPVGALLGINYTLPVASAQVKSSLLLAGLYAQGVTKVTEPAVSRDHTEIMLQALGAKITKEGLTTAIEGGQKLKGQTIKVPGDISSAAFLMVAAMIIPGSDILIRNVGVNPTRTGILDVFQAMGADITLYDSPEKSAEPVADIQVRYSVLQGVTVAGDLIPRLIDEIPAIAVAAAFAKGETVIADAAELKVKETNRIAAMVEGLTAMGVEVEERLDGMVIKGGNPLTGAIIDSRGDHRIAMSFAVAGLGATGKTEIADDQCIPVSFPGFAQVMRQLGATMHDRD